MNNSAKPVALITGAAHRLGAAIAEHLHANGFNVVLHYHCSDKRAQQLGTRLNAKRNNSAALVQADLARFDACAEVVAHAYGVFGRLDALVNNASVFFPTAFAESKPEQFEQLFAVNVRAPYFLAQAAAPHLRKQRGSIVNITDIYAQQPLAAHPLYSMSKAALAQMTRALALELAPDVRVNAIAPGAILWPQADDAQTLARQQQILDNTALGRIGTVQEVAEAVRWLLRDATFITGHSLPLDGGRGLK